MNVRKTIHSFLNESNDRTLACYDMLIEGFYECELKARGSANVIAVFFSDIATALMNYVLLDMEIENACQAPHEYLNAKSVSFPFFTYEALEKDFSFDTVRFSDLPRTTSFKLDCCSVLSQFVSYKRKKIALRSLGGVNYSAFLSLLTQHGFSYTFDLDTTISFSQYVEQMIILRKTIEAIFKALSLKASSEHFFKIVEHFISRFVKESCDSFPYDVFVCGTLVNTGNRICAARARLNNVPVVSIRHGEEDGACDQPILGYSEWTFATSIIGYGSFLEHDKGASYSYRKALYPNEKPHYVKANSNLCLRHKSSRAIPCLSDLAEPMYMYVPTSFSGTERHEPFRCLPDAIYKDWQNFIVKHFTPLIYKQHPKQKRVYDLGAIHVVAEPFEMCLNEADVFVFDYVSSAFCLAAATDKPIIYFNIGLRNLHEKAVQAIRERCIWIDVNLDDPSRSIEQLTMQRTKKCFNSFSSLFSLTGESESRERSIVRETLRLVSSSKIKKNRCAAVN